jgi:hypothetical protein
MMTQGRLPFQYLTGHFVNGLTSFSGLPLYMEMAGIAGLWTKISKTLQTKIQGWTDLQIIMSLILLNLAGGDCVDDIDRLEADQGLSTLLLKIETHGMRRKARREYERRWRKKKQRAFPSPTVIRRYLEKFHHSEQETLRVKGGAFIPERNELLQRLCEVNSTLISFAQQKNNCDTATLDQDATLSSTNKKSALYCYENYLAYQPFNTYWHEQGLLISSEFRDGNVPAGFEQLRVFEESLEKLPQGIKQVFLRSDAAGYQRELIKYCAEGKNERFGVIKFSISARVDKHFKQAVSQLKESDWHPIYKECDNGKIKTNQEWAEVCFVPNWTAHCKRSPDYRYIAMREKMVVQQELELEEKTKQLTFPFQTMELDKTQYKLFALVTNRTLPGNELINWHRKRCGDSEKVHSVEKSELAGGQFPSNKFGANAAWWQIMILSFNLNVLMKQLVLPDKLKKKSLKGIRFHLIHLAGQVICHARSICIKLSADKGVVDRVNQIRQLIIGLGQGPPVCQDR